MDSEQFAKTFWKRNRQYFEAAAETWYQRTHYLRELSKLKRQPLKRRQKAKRLWIEMMNRMPLVIQFSVILNTPRPSKNFPSGTIDKNKKN